MSFLLSRKSIVPQWMVDPAPSKEDIDYLLQAAVTAPDHGWLRPWRFLVIQGDARNKLSDLFVSALKKRNPEATREQIEKEQSRPQFAPLVIVVCSVMTDEKPGVPKNERVLSAGAAAQNILLAAHERGYGAIWLTGAAAYDPMVREGLDLDDNTDIVGFLYIGSVEREVRERKRPDPSEFTRYWGQ
ncbi:nitroreductase [Kiloniella laminariae]|uniref:Putative NAD(P)H nitroreductase n=1 Tax=Kiloniella laminariae TaxID=454162 RepID=A0ABT4LK56_9PROT|nr:nitroreductase [Kiloniella laminariae]MCZ4280741.1 nitroreductase [Kiloniella laminariae]